MVVLLLTASNSSLACRESYSIKKILPGFEPRTICPCPCWSRSHCIQLVPPSRFFNKSDRKFKLKFLKLFRGRNFDTAKTPLSKTNSIRYNRFCERERQTEREWVSESERMSQYARKRLSEQRTKTSNDVFFIFLLIFQISVDLRKCSTQKILLA